MGFLYLLILWLLVILVAFVFPTIEKNKKQKELNQLSVEKLTLTCDRKARFKEDLDFEAEETTGRIFFKIGNMPYVCKVPENLYFELETGQKFEAEFYIKEQTLFPDVTTRVYLIKSINGIAISDKYCDSYVED